MCSEPDLWIKNFPPPDKADFGDDTLIICPLLSVKTYVSTGSDDRPQRKFSWRNLENYPCCVCVFVCVCVCVCVCVFLVEGLWLR